MSRYAKLFSLLEAKKQGAFVPFVTLGDPNLADSIKIIQALIAGGADALELGFPFSDPAADGPTIQAANIRALSAGITPSDCLEMVSSIRAQHPDLPIGLLVYANLVFAPGLDTFYQRCFKAGVDSVLVADVPVHEAAPFIKAAKANRIAPIFIAPPNADVQTLKAVSEAGEGYTYLLSRAGVTGTETAAGMPVEHLLKSLKKYHAPPAILGFGIAKPEQVKQVINAGAAGAISGSAIVKLIEKHQHNMPLLCQKLTEFTQDMKAASKKN